MSITHYFQREISIPTKGSILLFGPRMTGKTSLLLKENFEATYDLLNQDLELKFRVRPELLFEECKKLPPGSRIFIDEVQKVPALLNSVQRGIDQLKQDYILSGSSARKLKRGGANLLGGRALDLKLYPLSQKELGSKFNLLQVLKFGTLPKIYSEQMMSEEIANDYLSSYVSTYIREEIQAEAATRNIGAFQRFLPIAAQSNAQTIQFETISRESSTPASTVKNYYQILEDTLLGLFLWPYSRSERKKIRPKFYFFDTGVVRALQNQIGILPSSSEYGFLFETWMINECIRINEYEKKRFHFSFWRERKNEIDLCVSKGNKVILGAEFKWGPETIPSETSRKFHLTFPQAELTLVSPHKNSPGITPLLFIQKLRNL
ncbi:MAG: hypothetical protein CL678_18680 [Bdellovibrionaceae bacterium]|nr:hypothetical protein [Pseudobdellovibrionaceae bacterium]|tara:strand:+ start:418 stop:1548 length:1131 start_codon:yes stop_codon:yes gene_type:complete